MSGDFGEDTPERIARRLPPAQRTALGRMELGEVDCFVAGIPQGTLRALRAKGLVEGRHERWWRVTPRGLEVLGLLAS
jgi:hypothetical protein